MKLDAIGARIVSTEGVISIIDDDGIVSCIVFIYFKSVFGIKQK